MSFKKGLTLSTLAEVFTTTKLAATIGTEVWRTTAELGYLEVNVICLCKSPVDLYWGEWHFPLLTLILTEITSMQLQNKQASRSLDVYTTTQFPSKITDTLYKKYVN
jgi:hypothetical protein